MNPQESSKIACTVLLINPSDALMDLNFSFGFWAEVCSAVMLIINSSMSFVSSLFIYLSIISFDF
jgi:hypothetical protein